MKQKDVERRQKAIRDNPPKEFTCQICHRVMDNIHMGKFQWICDICECKADSQEDVDCE